MSVCLPIRPSLPVPLAHASGALLDNKIFVAGGQENMDSPCATSHFFMLDLSQKESGWQVLDSWPGKPRGFAVSAVQSNGVDKCFYLFSGRDYDAEGNVEILSDGYVYNPKTEEWSVLSGEFPVMAGTAVPQGANHLLLLGGSDSMLPAGERHPGFDNRVRLFHTVTQTLVVKEESPYAIPLTTNVLAHDGAFYLTSGEIHPGVRTPEIVSFRILPYEKNFGIVNYLVIAFYFMLLAWIGYYFSKRQKNTDDYFKGGGRIPWWVVGLSIFGTALSAITFMAIPARAYASDWSYIFINAGILLVVPIIIYLFIPFFRKLDSTTAYEYLEARFNYAVRMFSSLLFHLVPDRKNGGSLISAFNSFKRCHRTGYYTLYNLDGRFKFGIHHDGRHRSCCMDRGTSGCGLDGGEPCCALFIWFAIQTEGLPALFR